MEYVETQFYPQSLEPIEISYSGPLQRRSGRVIVSVSTYRGYVSLDSGGKCIFLHCLRVIDGAASQYYYKPSGVHLRGTAKILHTTRSRDMNNEATNFELRRTVTYDECVIRDSVFDFDVPVVCCV
jgi:hypothetical protein